LVFGAGGWYLGVGSRVGSSVRSPRSSPPSLSTRTSRSPTRSMARVPFFARPADRLFASWRRCATKSGSVRCCCMTNSQVMRTTPGLRAGAWPTRRSATACGVVVALVAIVLSACTPVDSASPARAEPAFPGASPGPYPVGHVVV